MLIDFMMIAIFIRMYINFLKAKIDSMKERLVRWRCKNTMHVIGVAFLVFLDAARTTIEALTSQGFGLDDDPDKFTTRDFIRSLIEYAASSLIDFLIAMVIFVLIWEKTKS